jgi:hypothetical protein
VYISKQHISTLCLAPPKVHLKPVRLSCRVTTPQLASTRQLRVSLTSRRVSGAPLATLVCIFAERLHTRCRASGKLAGYPTVSAARLASSGFRLAEDVYPLQAVRVSSGRASNRRRRGRLHDMMVQRASFRSELHQAHAACFVSGLLSLARSPVTLFRRRNSRGSSRPYLYPRLRQSAVKDGRCVLIRGEKLTTPLLQRNARQQAAMCTNIHEHCRHGARPLYPKFEGNSKASALPPAVTLSWIGRTSPRHRGAAAADRALLDDSINLGTCRNVSLLQRQYVADVCRLISMSHENTRIDFLLQCTESIFRSLRSPTSPQACLADCLSNSSGGYFRIPLARQEASSFELAPASQHATPR